MNFDCCLIKSKCNRLLQDYNLKRQIIYIDLYKYVVLISL